MQTFLVVEADPLVAEDLAEVIGEELRSRSLTLATAESCTGGWLGKLLTDIPGSSDYFLGSIVCYSNEAKISLLGVEEESLQSSGAVSRSVAKSMALGVKERLSADIGLSVTGVAGPGGGTEEKPVGTVYVGLALPDETKVRRLSLPGDREVVRFRTAQIALDWVRRSLA